MRLFAKAMYVSYSVKLAKNFQKFTENRFSRVDSCIVKLGICRAANWETRGKMAEGSREKLCLIRVAIKIDLDWAPIALPVL